MYLKSWSTGLDWPLCHCVVAQAPPFKEHRRALVPSTYFDLCVSEKNYIIANSYGPLPTPVVVMKRSE